MQQNDQDFRNLVMNYARKAGRYDSLCDAIRGLSGSEIAHDTTGDEMIDFLLSIIEKGEQ